MSTAETEQSTAHVLVAHVWNNVQEATGHSWLRLNHAMYEAVKLAIEAGLRFDVGDFATFYSEMRGGYWFGQGDGSGMGERFYGIACKYGNDSACKSFEAWKARAPFVFGGSRLAVGSDLEWQDLRVTVTSFAEDGQSLTACSYKGGERKVERRLTITCEQIKAAEKARKAADKDAKEVAKIREGLGREEIRVTAENVAGWSKDQRAEVLAWIGRGRVVST